jgi:hypothetical protein
MTNVAPSLRLVALALAGFSVGGCDGMLIGSASDEVNPDTVSCAVLQQQCAQGKEAFCRRLATRCPDAAAAKPDQQPAQHDGGAPAPDQQVLAPDKLVLVPDKLVLVPDKRALTPDSKPVDTSPPTVSLAPPAGGTTIASARTVSIVASASDNVGVVKVELYDGGALKLTATAPPYAYAWAVTAAANGSHSWTAKAFDAAGNSKVSAPLVLTVAIPTPDTTAPTFAGLAAATGTSASEVTLSWTAASDNVTPAAGIVYLVYKSTSPTVSFAAPALTTAAGATSAVVPGLAASTTTYFAVRARDAAGNVETNTVVRSATTSSSTPTAPQPPFGSTVGVTASDFSIPDCSGASFDLHAQYGKYPAVVVAFSWTGFT